MTNNQETPKPYSHNIVFSIEKANAENNENRRKTLSNLNKSTKDIEPYDNTCFLNMINNIVHCY